MSVITGLLLTGSSVLGGSINVMAANPANYKDTWYWKIKNQDRQKHSGELTYEHIKYSS